MGPLSRWKVLDWARSWLRVGVAGGFYRSEVHSGLAIGQRAGCGLSVIGSWQRCGRRCKTLCFLGSFCWLTLAS